MSQTLFLASLVLFATLSAAHLVVGLVRDARRASIQRRADAALAALASGLFNTATSDSDSGVELRIRSRADRRALVETIRSLPVDMDGQLLDGLRAIMGSHGVARHVRRLGRSRRWRHRAEAAELQFLVSEDLGDLRPALLADEHPEVRLRAVQGLTPRQCRPLAAVLVDLLFDPRAEVRSAALNAAASAGSVAVAPAIRRLEHGGPEVADVLRLCALVPDVRFLPVLEHHAGADSPLNRSLAARALGNALTTQAAPLLHVLLVDPDASVRAAATTALGRLRHDESAPRLARRLGDPEWIVREAAGSALIHLGPSGELFLRLALDDPDPFARDMAQRSLDLVRPVVVLA